MLRVAQIAEIVASDQSPNFSAERNEALFSGIGSKVLIPPGGEYFASTTLREWKKLDATELQVINSGKMVIFVHGTISYEDVFGCWHWTIFCYRFNPIRGYDVYETHNDADDNRCP